MRWTPQTILTELRLRHTKGEPLNYRSLARMNRSLVSAAAYHFGSFKKAVVSAGIDYTGVSGRPKWSKPQIIQAIKAARRAGRDLSWTAVMAAKSPLRNAAFVAVQKRMFGGWPRALEAAGVDADASRRYQDWDKTVVVADLKQLHADGTKLNSSAVRISNPRLHAAAVRYFGSFDKALRAARLKARVIRLRKTSKRD